MMKSSFCSTCSPHKSSCLKGSNSKGHCSITTQHSLSLSRCSLAPASVVLQHVRHAAILSQHQITALPSPPGCRRPVQPSIGQRSSVRAHAAAGDGSLPWTLDQIAGLAFGGVMLLFVVSARQVDIFFARSQRRQLGLCEECGGVFDAPTCTLKNCPMRGTSAASIGSSSGGSAGSS